MSAEEIKYTVKQPSKITRLSERPKDPRPSAWISGVKWVFAFFLSMSLLICIVSSKISLLSIAMYFNATRLPTGVTHPEYGEQSQPETVFVMLILALMIPFALTFLRSCWVSLFRSSHLWPSNSALFWCVVSSVIEVAALCYFTIIPLMYTSLPATYCILISNSVFCFPIAWHLWKLWRNFNENRRLFFATLASLILELGSLGVLAYKVSSVLNTMGMSTHKSASIMVLLPASMVLLSIAWSPKVQKKMLEPRGDQYDELDAREASMRTTAGLPGSSEGDPAPPVFTPQTAAHLLLSDGKNARGKSAIITSLIKLIITPIIAGLIAWPYGVLENLGDVLSKGFGAFTFNHLAFPHFLAQIFTSVVGYILGWLACSMCLQKIAYALPLILATPVSLALVFIPKICASDRVPMKCEYDDGSELYYIVVLAACLWLAQLLWTGCFIWKEQTFIMARESSLFWMPLYNGVFLEQNLLLNRKNVITDEFHVNQREIAKNACVYICTTMYHETEEEMEQLLHSLHDIDTARAASKRQFESHVFFDGAVKGEVLNDFVLQLIALVPKTLKVKVEAVMKIKTPYGMQFRWRLPGGMPFHIHLKDNLKVKNKKRWSQVMYMSYILDYKEGTMGSTDENTYILATDADVRFTHGDVQALLDLLMRDPRVGAVCGRTHPLGVGPIVWYQVFDYAIGHWFQKTANHVLGTVLCSPGCFSAYRCLAVRDVLPTYATGVTTSTDFLTKDMGEDRWFCTLMVQSGWRLEYCAAAEDSTFCPDNFDEFFRQRRRWIPSTLANLLQLISQWRVTTENNDMVSIWFILYQALNVVATLICPATVILIISGALHYAHLGVEDELIPAVLLVLVSIGYALVCLYTKQEFQLKVAKLLTIIFALIMAFVVVGMAAQIAIDLQLRSTPKPTTSPVPTALVPTTQATTPMSTSTAKTAVDRLLAAITSSSTPGPTAPSGTSSPLPTTSYVPLKDRLPADVTSLYLGGLVGIFLIAALLHPFEAFCLVHGMWYLLCLPSGYLLLIIYSVCNVTDRSWGTRETKEKKSGAEVPWYEELWKTIKYVFTCCRPAEPNPDPQAPATNNQTDNPPSQYEDSSSSETNGVLSDEEQPPLPLSDSSIQSAAPPEVMIDETHSPSATPPMPKSVLKLRKAASLDADSPEAPKWRFPGERKVRFDTRLPKLLAEMPVEEWLPGELKGLYLKNFKDNGYDNVSFIAGMTNKDLRAIGISTRGHRMQLVYAIERIPHVTLNADVPESVEEWLHELGLECYWEYFVRNGYNEPRVLEDLKAMDFTTLKQTLKADLNINKAGHLTKMISAIKKLQYPTPSEREIRRARELVKEAGHVIDMEKSNQDDGMEFKFWKGLREACLLPESAIFGAVTELKEKLEDLRDSILMVFAMTNAIWMILMVTLTKTPQLKVLGTDALGLAFLAIYGFIIVLQFLTLIWHRLSTWCHMIARAPWTRGPYKMAWAFSDENLVPEPTQADLERVRRLRHKRRRRSRHSSSDAHHALLYNSTEQSSTSNLEHSGHTMVLPATAIA
ncbi:uncharacterized protein LOC5506512 [Nematostella vectensis]|uniref:uncharacterized protein LOC5506512 n=1 Tax=Nematostella vectensis TaxID=45351 RepID=UPI0020778975|nr:uncharacterized protein LOC5506512 [Nematostella vectensis]